MDELNRAIAKTFQTGYLTIDKQHSSEEIVAGIRRQQDTREIQNMNNNEI
eukprot:GAHX01001950.1.p5 GENE.GAHX01001950.1~~GAHX01001950.1.p5  ORF type:complete len:50 (-),score=11.73 GAHX01001950.1:952-1101(-)